MAKAELGNHKDAIADYNQAIALNPQNAEAYNNRGIVKGTFRQPQGCRSRL